MIIPAIIYFIVFSVVALFFAPAGYVWTRNTVSELAAQGHKYKWIMQAGFIGFGLLLNIGFLTRFVAAGQVFYPDLFIMLYGMSILLSGIFCTEPLDRSIPYSERESHWYTIFASAAGIFFSLSILGYVFSASSDRERIMNLIFLVLVLGSSMLVGLSKNKKIGLGLGIAQRLLHLVSFVWMIVVFW